MLIKCVICFSFFLHCDIFLTIQHFTPKLLFISSSNFKFSLLLYIFIYFLHTHTFIKCVYVGKYRYTYISFFFCKIWKILISFHQIDLYVLVCLLKFVVSSKYFSIVFVLRNMFKSYQMNMGLVLFVIVSDQSKIVITFILNTKINLYLPNIENATAQINTRPTFFWIVHPVLSLRSSSYSKSLVKTVWTT